MTSYREANDAAAVGAAIYASLPDLEPRSKHLIEHLLRMLADRDRYEEDFFGQLSTAALPVLVFSYAGALAAGIESPPYYPPAPFTATQIRVSLLANASVNHVIEIHVNGALVTGGSVTLLAGAKTVTVVINQPLLTTDYVTAKTITVADQNLSVEVT